MPISATDSITLAFQHTRRQLMQPFRLGQWTRLALVGFLAGELGSSGGCNFPQNFNFPRHPEGSQRFLESPFSSIDPTLLAVLIGVLVVAVLVFGLIMMYVSSVMRFTLFDSVLEKECHIRREWSRRQGEGWRYFLWQLSYSLAVLGGMLLLLGIPALIALALGWFKDPGQHMVGLVLGGIVVFLLFMIFTLGAAVVQVLTKDFVVPQMALEKIGAIEGWRRLWPMLQADGSGYGGYVGMKIVLAIGAGIVVGIASLILGLMVAFPTVLLGIVAVFTGKTAGLTWNVFTITVAVVAGCILLAAFLYLLALISVPLIVFFPAYSIYFFAPRYRALSLVLYPPRPEAPGLEPARPPEEPPPLMPAPTQ